MVVCAVTLAILQWVGKQERKKAKLHVRELQSHPGEDSHEHEPLLESIDEPTAYAHGNKFISFQRTNQQFVAPLGSSMARTVHIPAEMDLRGSSHRETHGALKSLKSAALNVLQRPKTIMKAAFFAGICGVLGALYTESGQDSEFDKELKKLHKFYEIVQWLPVLLLGMYLSREVARFVSLMIGMNAIASELESMALQISQLAACEDDTPVLRSWLFKMYRYLNLLHWFVYSKSAFRRETITEELKYAGLLQAQEVPEFEASGGCPRLVASWLAQEFQAVFGGKQPSVASFVNQVRVTMGTLDDVNDLLTVMGPISSYRLLMNVFVYLSSLLLAIGFAYDFWDEDRCFQGIGVAATFTMTWTYLVLIRLTEDLQQPFQHLSASDMLYPEISLLQTEGVIYSTLRSSFVSRGVRVLGQNDAISVDVKEDKEESQ